MTAQDAYRVIKRFYKKYPLTSGSEYKLISDNLYLIKQRVSCTAHKRKKTLAVRLRKYLIRARFVFSADGLIEHFRSHNWKLKTSDVYAMGDVLCTILTATIAGECDSFMKNGRGSTVRMNASIESLRRLSELDLSEIFEALCPTEAIFADFTGFSEGDEQTKDIYRSALVKYAKKHRTDELTALRYAAGRCKDGRLLAVLEPFSHTPAVLYYASSIIALAGLTAISVMLWGWLSLFALLPLAECVLSVMDFVFSRLVRAKPTLRLSPEFIPSNAETLVVITTLLFGGKKDDELFERLEEFYLRSDRPELKFGILGDLCDASKPELDGDSEIIENAIKNIERLNAEYGNVFSLFIRKRHKNAADGIYGGRERKRGAVTELIAAIHGKTTPQTCLCPFELKNIRYLLTLDSDTDLPIDGAEDLLCVALHPENMPVVKDGKVVSGFGVFQPLVRTRLSDSTRTYHSLFGSRASGIYERACYDRYQTLHGSGVFCGKGLIDVRLFEDIVAPSVPDGVILSHDVIEGGLVRCMLVSDTVFCDSTPKNSISYFRRQHRWVRGDVQNVIFLGSSRSNPALSFRLLENLRRLLTPISAAVGIVISAFFAVKANEIPLFLLLSSNIWLPALLGMFGTAVSRAYTPRRFFSRCVGALAQSLEGTLYSLCSLAENAATTADAAIRSLWRLTVSHKKLLSWTTFSQSNAGSEGTIYSYVQNHVSSVFAGTVIAAFSGFTLFRLIGLLWFFFPVIAYILSRPVKDRTPPVTDAERKTVTAYAKEIFAFFDENVTKKTHYLPPDNVQLSPAECIAYRTSPTNIGFYIISLIAARDFCFIDTQSLAKRAENVISTIESMEKCRGHLFNWYDIKTLKPIGGKYISAVDSGNLVTMLICAAAGFDEYAHENSALSGLAERCRRIACGADFSIFYNKKKHLLYLGCNSDGKPEGNICYDMLMSEIRTTCYWLCASGRLPKKMWQSLSRTITAENGYIGMVSWAGSCFEYFMPELFLPRERDSFIDESMRFAVSSQKRYRKNGVFGISESGYFAFDPDMNYRYKAHGVPQLALKRYPPSEFVVSPYSSFLMMRDDPSACLKNLSALEDMGCRGKYGFFEAVDLTEGESIVQSFMSHHLGMSLTACANLCFDGVFIKRFMKDKRLSACRELLAESIPKDAMLYIGEDSRTPTISRRISAAPEITDDNISLISPTASFVSDSGLTLISSSSGHIGMKCGVFGVNSAVFELYKNTGTASFTFFENGVKRCFTPLEGNMSFSYEYSGSHFAFTSSSPKFPASVVGTVYRSCRTFAFKTRCSNDRSCKIGFSFIPILVRQEEYSAHSNFSSMFIESSYDASKRILYFKRRGGSYPHCAVALGDASLIPQFTANLEHLNAHSLHSMSDVFPLPDKPNGIGACVDPLCAILTPELKGGSAVFLVSCGISREECEEQIEKARKRTFPRQYIKPPSVQASELLTECLFKKPGNKLCPVNSSCLWKLSLSGNLPLRVLEVYEETSEVKALLKAFLQLKNAFISTELLFIVHEKEKYLSPLRTFIDEAISGEYAPFMYRAGGIAVADAESFSKEEMEFLRQYAAAVTESDSISGKRLPSPLFIPPEIIGKNDITDGETVFSPDGCVRDTKKRHKAPYSYVMSGYSCGSVVTHDTLGFVFWRNARECRVTPFDGSPYAPHYGLRLVVMIDSKYYDIAAYSDEVVYESGKAVYSGSIVEHKFALTVYARSKLPAVEYHLHFENGFAPVCMLIKEQPQDTSAEDRNGVWVFQNQRHSAVPFVGFMKCSEKCELINDSALLFCGIDGGRRDILAMKCEKSNVIFAVGGSPSIKAVPHIAELCAKEYRGDEAEAFVKEFTPEFRLQTGNRGLDSMFSSFAPYQAAIAHFFGKTGFYQTSGAFGFRDQLQTCFTLIYSSPKTVKRHLLRCASHQYREGDVMHWWFKAPVGDTGIRTTCSDDFLYLPWAVADYIEKTGDADILKTEICYMESPPLTSVERYETPKISECKETLYMHCIRALAYGERLGSHGLSLMGSCDWNDGMSHIGAAGVGESVFTSWLYVLVCREFLPIMKKVGDFKSIAHFTSVSADLVLALERRAFDGDRYIRAIDDNGNIVGAEGSPECKIDILSQAFASMVMGKTERTVKAMNTAADRLFDRRLKILKLFDPPFDSYNAGYISSYCPGLRENGGQYTHGALWGILGLIRCGETAKALEILNAIMPYSHTDEQLFRAEPYVITADIYSGSRGGRGGWSWYSGSASWFFVIVLEEILGIRLSNDFTEIDAYPLTDYSITLKLPRGTVTVFVSSLFSETSLDGKPVKLPVTLTDGDHRLEIKR